MDTLLLQHIVISLKTFSNECYCSIRCELHNLKRQPMFKDIFHAMSFYQKSNLPFFDSQCLVAESVIPLKRTHYQSSERNVHSKIVQDLNFQ